MGVLLLRPRLSLRLVGRSYVRNATPPRGAHQAPQENLDAEDGTLRRITNLKIVIKGRMDAAGDDVGALRTAIASIADQWWACLPSKEAVAAWNQGDGPIPLTTIPEIRAEAVNPEPYACAACRSGSA